MTEESVHEVVPFDTVLKAQFELRGLESIKHAAHLQYKLMLLEPVVRVHINYPKKLMDIEYVNPTKNTEKIIDALKPVRAVLKSKEPEKYMEIVRKGFHE